MIYSNDGKTFSFNQIQTSLQKNHIRQPLELQHNFPLQLTSQNYLHKQTLMSKIDSAAQCLRQKTIHFVQTLRKYTLPRNLETEIQLYLTDVLDQIDFLQREQGTGSVSPSQKQLFNDLPFSQHDKPKGDEQEMHFQQTLREINLHSNLQRKDIQNENLSKKIQTILKSIQSEQAHEFQQRPENEQETFQIKQIEIINNIESRVKGAHRFSSNYIRDIQKPKKNRVL